MGGRLRSARQAAGLSMRDAGARLGVSAGAISAWENGRTRVSPQRIASAAALFGVPARNLDPAAGVRLAATTAVAVGEPFAGGGWRHFDDLELPPPLAGALQAFVEFGYHGAGVREIAQRAGLSPPGVYHHWPTKQHLLVALLDRTMGDLLGRARAARAEGEGPVQRFTNLVECLALYHTHRRDLGFIGASEMRSVEPVARQRISMERQSLQHMLDDEVVEGCRRGLMHTPLPREAARAVVTMCTALPQWWRPDGPSTPETVAGQYVQFALDLTRTGA